MRMIRTQHDDGCGQRTRYVHEMPSGRTYTMCVWGSNVFVNRVDPWDGSDCPVKTRTVTRKDAASILNSWRKCAKLEKQKWN